MDASSKSFAGNLNVREIECSLPTHVSGLASQAGDAPGNVRSSKNECVNDFGS
jgi:hypothetical protein